MQAVQVSLRWHTVVVPGGLGGLCHKSRAWHPKYPQSVMTGVTLDCIVSLYGVI